MCKKNELKVAHIRRMPHFIMNPLPCWISLLGLLLCLTVWTCRAVTISAFEGQDITLPCKYDSRNHGICDICWMRGSIPNNGCGSQIIYANEKKVVMRANVRYQLYGALQRGDASLTILNARKSDSGQYGCRVHVPGWFNDKKIQVYLVIREAIQQTSTTLGHTTMTHTPTHAPFPTTQHETTTIAEHVTTEHTETEQTSTTLEYVTTTMLIPTTEPFVTTQDETPSVPEHAIPMHTETQETLSTLRYVTTMTHSSVVTHGPVFTTQHETTTAHEHVTTKHTEEISEESPDASSPENDILVNEDTDVLPAILVPVILIVLILGFITIYLMSKHKRRLREKMKIAKNSSASVNYSNLNNSVTLPMTNSFNN